MSERFIELTQLDGHKFYVAVAEVHVVREPRPSEFAGSAAAIVVVSYNQYAVQETMLEVIHLIRYGA